MDIYFRCDASATIGIGHVVRCIVLAEQLIELGFHVKFISSITEYSFLRNKLENLEILILDPSSFIDYKNVILIEYLVIIDTPGRSDLPDSFLAGSKGTLQFLNSSLQINSTDLFISPGLRPRWVSDKDFSLGKYFYGLEYLIMPKELVDAKRNTSVEKKLVITLGGSNTGELVLEILTFLDSARYPRPILVFVPSFIHLELDSFSHLRIEMLDLTTDIYREISTASDVICGSGTSIYQVLFLNKRAMGVLVAENQIPNFEYLSRNGFIFGIRSGFSSRAQEISIFEKFIGEEPVSGFDGIDEFGANRIVDLILDKFLHAL
jgi:spore coat polysaccharide biosynthesis predicted glycosyltransferase SpsG